MSRLAGAVLLLPALIVLQYVTDDAFFLLVSIALPILFLVSLAAAVLLRDASRRRPDIVSLRARADDAIFLALASGAAAAMGLLVVARAFGVDMPAPREIFLVGVSYALIVLSAPAVNWLVVWKPWRPEIVVPAGEDAG